MVDPSSNKLHVPSPTTEQVMNKFSSFVSDLEQRIQVIERQQDTVQNSDNAPRDRIAFQTLLCDHIAVFCPEMCAQMYYGSCHEFVIMLAEEAPDAKTGGFYKSRYPRPY